MTTFDKDLIWLALMFAGLTLLVAWVVWDGAARKFERDLLRVEQADMDDRLECAELLDKQAETMVMQSKEINFLGAELTHATAGWLADFETTLNETARLSKRMEAVGSVLAVALALPRNRWLGSDFSSLLTEAHTLACGSDVVVRGGRPPFGVHEPPSVAEPKLGRQKNPRRQSK